MEQISWKPRAFLYHNFLSDAECEHLKELSRRRLTKSTVVDNQTGKSVPSSVRTSSGTFLARGEDEVVRAIERRLSLITMIPEGAGAGSGWEGRGGAGRGPVRRGLQGVGSAARQISGDVAARAPLLWLPLRVHTVPLRYLHPPT